MAIQRILLIFTVFLHPMVFSQSGGETGETDDAKRWYQKEQQFIKRSTLYSAILPGLGQINNNKAWKIPVIYGIATGLIFSATNSNTNYRFFRKNFLAEVSGSQSSVNTTNLNAAQLERRVSFFRRNRDLSYIFLAMLYFINVIDAHVDAHFRGFEMNEKLSISLGPLTPAPRQNLVNECLGVGLLMRFH